MKNDIHEGPVADILKNYDEKKIGLEETGGLLLHEIRNNGGDIAYVEPELYQAVLDAAGIKETVSGQKVGDLLICRYFGTQLQPQIPRERGEFTSMNRVANWEDPKWLSGEHAWSETGPRIFIDGLGGRITQEDLSNIDMKRREPLRFKDIQMIVQWEAQSTTRPVDVLVWKEWNASYTELLAIHHTTFVLGVPFHDHIEDNSDIESED